MKRGSILFLQTLIVLVGLAVLAICIFVLPGMASRDAAANPDTSYLQYPFLIVSYLMASLFLFSIFQAFRLLTYVGANIAFSEHAVRALKVIRLCTLVVIGLVVAGTLFVAFALEGDRAGAIALGLYATIAASGLGAFVAVLTRLVKNAADLKTEHDLTV